MNNQNNNHVGNILDVTVEKMRSVADSDTIIGDRIELAEGVTAIPVSKVSYGFASGGADFRVKSNPNSPLFGGGGGGGMTVTPVGFLVCKGTDVRMVSVHTQESPAMGAIALLPDLFERLVDLFKKSRKEAEEENEDVIQF